MKQILFILLLLTFHIGNGQTAKAWLDSIAKNNQELKSSKQFWEARKLEYRTGLNPPDPTLEYDYLIGTPAEAGNQADFIAVQSFDFPSAYFIKRSLASEQAEQADLQVNIARQNILLEARLFLSEAVYLNKRQSELEKRLENVGRLNRVLETKLDRGDANILDVNKARLQMIKIETELRETEKEKAVLLQKLSRMNGGNPLAVSDTIYQVEDIIPDFEELEKLIESTDPLLKYFIQQKEINETQVGLAKALRLPRFETGYHSQAILGQNFRGIHMGMSIPLWENRNTVKSQEANVAFSELKIEEHRTEHYFEIKQLYEEHESLKKSLDAYRTLLVSFNSEGLLWKALQLGEISLIEYFLELGYFYSAYDAYLELEKEYYKSIARLNKYTL